VSRSSSRKSLPQPLLVDFGIALRGRQIEQGFLDVRSDLEPLVELQKKNISARFAKLRTQN
jgi:hypothetical protein